MHYAKKNNWVYALSYNAHIGLNSISSDGKDLAMGAGSGAEVAGSEPRADVAPKDK